MTQRESGHSKPRHLFDAERQAIRFRLTLLLGLSLFNAIIALLLTVTPLRFIADAPSEEVIRHCRSTAVLVDTAYGQALTAISRPTPQTLADISSTLDQVEGKLAALEDSGALQQDLQLYRQATEDWMEMLIAAPDAVQAAESEAGQQLLGELKIQHYRLASGLALMMDIALPRWADVVLAQARWVILWLIFSALLTVSLVFELRSLTQKPLLTLRSAALKVAAGDLEAPIPVPGRASEIRSLARSIDAMRARLVRSIRDLDIQNREMELILENMTDGVLLMDAAGRIQEINPQGVQVLHSMSGSIPCEGDRTIGLIPDLTAELLVAEAPAELTVSYAEGSGKQRWVQVSLRVVPGSEGREPVWVLVLRDTTHEQELEQLQRDFLSVVTHELKTPLTAIQGYAGLLARGKGGSLSARQEQFVQIIRTQSDVLRDMVQNLLDVTRLEGGRLPLDIQPTEVEPMLMRLWSTWQGAAGAAGITLERSLQGLQGLQHPLDAFRMDQVLGNLISNALKFTPDGGCITLRGRTAGGSLVIEVQDTGRGIPPKSIPQLFTKFFQVARGDTRISGGSGLGLYIAKQLVEAQGGAISVTSVVGEGSCFRVEFPLQESRS